MAENVPPWNVPSEMKIAVFNKPLRIKYSDIFDMKEFYDLLHEWLMEQNWKSYDGKDDEQWETYYGERRDRNGAREIWCLWKLRKSPGALDIPLNFFMNIYWHVIHLTDTEVVREGQKFKVNKGSVEIKLYPVIEETYKKNLAAIPIIKDMPKIADFFAHRIYHRAIEKRKKQLYRETMDILNFTKQWFKLKRYLPYEEAELFFPSKAWPSHKQYK